MDQKYESVNCLVCNSNYSELFFEGIGKTEEAFLSHNYRATANYRDKIPRLVKCNRCGLIYVNPRPIRECLYRLYNQVDDPDYEIELAGRQKTFLLLLDQLEKYVSDKSVLDIGCATGIFLESARSRGWQIAGMEISSWAKAIAEKRLGKGIIINEQETDKQLLPASYSLVTMFDIIEHLFRPDEYMNTIKKVLKKDGYLLIVTPDIGSLPAKVLGKNWWFIYLAHLTYFNKKTLRMFLDKQGFKIVETWPFPRYFSLRYFLERGKNYFPFTSRLLKSLGTKSALIERIIKISLFDQLAVLAKRIDI